MNRRPLLLCSVLALASLLAGCEIPGMGPDPRIAQREADAKAVGAGCRHATRGIEDCYALNPRANKSQVFIGWKDMDLYMRENKIEGVTPSLVPPPAGEVENAAIKDKLPQAHSRPPKKNES